DGDLRDRRSGTLTAHGGRGGVPHPDLQAGAGPDRAQRLVVNGVQVERLDDLVSVQGNVPGVFLNDETGESGPDRGIRWGFQDVARVGRVERHQITLLEGPGGRHPLTALGPGPHRFVGPPETEVEPVVTSHYEHRPA